MPGDIRPITDQSYPQAAHVLATAFVNDPVTQVCFKGFTPEQRVRALTTDFTNELKVCLRRGYPVQLVEDGVTKAVAVIYPPGTYPYPQVDLWKIMLKSALASGLQNVRSWMGWMNGIDAYHPKEAHYYLEYLGVAPECQGQGYGSLLLRHMTAKADELGVGCYLENALLRNVPFYQRAGFTQVREEEIIGIHAWLMWRAKNI
jgi:GNAT superfamily N-acetyltransferase